MYSEAQMVSTVAILDDEPERLHAMTTLLGERFPVHQVVTFDNAPDFNAWLADNLQSCVVICLDHDLGPNRKRQGTVFDPGVGRDVVNYLAGRVPNCPVVIHTTNTNARPGMISTLEECGWLVSFVSPYEDTLWIDEVWADEISRLLT